ncbi:MAG: DUF2924 domain-containing protein [Rhizobiales bacterium]|nr:DUF2924 domain-containing protein [Hyphomicrobiales bacterium]
MGARQTAVFRRLIEVKLENGRCPYPRASEALSGAVQGRRSQARRSPVPPRRIKPGSKLVQTWNRRTYRFRVLDKGLAYDGKTFASLSEIATAITGTRWNGPRFFGLRSAGSADGSDGDAG